jgi:hypothetical protein
MTHLMEKVFRALKIPGNMLSCMKCIGSMDNIRWSIVIALHGVGRTSRKELIFPGCVTVPRDSI